MAKKLINTKNISHEEWLTYRKNSIGGSDAGAIVGMNQWASPVTVYLDKLGMSKDKETSEAMRLGTDLEDYVAKRFEEKTGKRVRNDNFMYQHDDYEFITANIDRTVVGENAGLECKTMNAWADYDLEFGEVPQQYFCQCQHYMAVMGYERMYLCVLIFQKGVYVVSIERDQNFIDQLIAEEVRFWKEHVETHIMPAPDESDATKSALDELWPAQTPGEQIEMPELDELAREYKECGDAEKRLKDRKNEIRNVIAAKMKTAERADSNGFYVTLKAQSRKSLKNADDFEKRYPEVYKLYVTESSSRTLRVNKKKGA